MTDNSITLSPPLPLSLMPWIALNEEFHVLLCVGHRCRQAVSPGAISRHLHRFHQVSLNIRKQADQYIQQSRFAYEFYNIQLPPDGSAPQPIVPVIDVFCCCHCHYKTRNRKAVSEHGNKVHQKKRAQDAEVFIAV